MMIRCILFFIVSLSAFKVFSSLPSSTDRLLRESQVPLKYFSVWIKDGQKTYEYRADQMMIPASLSKIVTAGAALDLLGPGYKFTTEVYHTGSIASGVLKGDLYLKGHGNPAMVSEDFWAMVNELKRSDIRKVEGNLYVDDSVFDQVRYPPSRRKQRVDRAYDAPIGAMSFNWNSVNVHVRPAARTGRPARVYIDPANDYIELKNESVTGQSTKLKVHRESRDGKDVIRVSGTMALGAKEKTLYKSITRPDLWAGYNFKSFMKQQGIVVSGSVANRRVPKASRLLVSYDSKPLPLIIADMMKFSNNYVAEMLAKSLSLQKPAVLSMGVARIRSWLQKQGLPEQSYILKNPSGLSTENRFQARYLGMLLEKMKNRFSLSPEFLAALPIANVDGTLKKRLHSARARARAKTGFIGGAVGLAGFVKKKKRVITFVLMYNGPRKYEYKARDALDFIVGAL